MDISGANWHVMFGSCLNRLPELADNSIDAVVCDPPYELGFMGKSWDSSGIAYNVDVWRECLRVLKPGGHLLAFGGSRTWHRIAVAIEDAGFEVRDSIAWMYGSGFPKSLDVSKAIDKAAGAEREVIGSKMASPKGISAAEGRTDTAAGSYGGEAREIDITAPATPEAQKWSGWGTALKPAFEPVVVARKPLIGTVAANVLAYGTGGLNIDGTRIGSETVGWQGVGRSGDSVTTGASQGGEKGGYNYGNGQARPVQGRWPSNVMLDEFTAALVDEQSGFSKSTGVINRWTDGAKPFGNGAGGSYESVRGVADSSGASRFFYVAKASKRDRNEGLEHLEAKRASAMWYDIGLGEAGEGMFKDRNPQKQNFHPTVKPTELMRYLIKLVTPPGGLVLDPFTGSGSTGKAALLDGYRFIGCELTEDYLPIIEGRLNWAVSEQERIKNERVEDEAGKLF